MKISASFLSSENIPKDLVKLNETDVDYIHVDVMDGKFVPGKTMPFKEMKNIYKFTDKRLDVHLMVQDPGKYIPLYAELNTEYITFHIEVENVSTYLELIKSYGIKAGLAIKPYTPIKSLVPYLPLIDMVLVMGVEPGKGGQEFILDTESKILELKDLIQAYHSDVIINVDGGINEQTKEYCKKCDILTAGSYIIKSDNFQEMINRLR